MVVWDATAGGDLLKPMVIRDETALLRASSAIVLRNLLIACRFSTIFLVFSIKKRIFWQIYEQYKGDLIMMLGINAKR